MYKIKHTGEQVDRLLKDVFDSTLQTKDIEITENGVIEVTPDEGYLGLAKVNVNIDVPTEGGGDNVVYLDITQAVYPMERYLEVILTLMPILTVKIPSMKSIRPSSWAVASGNFEYISACAILPNVRVIDADNDANSNDVIEDFKQFGAFEITEEEFYHIPQDEVWPLNTQEDYKTAWDKLYPLVERYGADYINENKLSLAPWYKSLTLESEWGTVNISEIVKYRSGLNGESNEDAIQFDGCALTKRYEDGGITYHLFIDEA